MPHRDRCRDFGGGQWRGSGELHHLAIANAAVAVNSDVAAEGAVPLPAEVTTRRSSIGVSGQGADGGVEPGAVRQVPEVVVMTGVGGVVVMIR